MSRFVLGATTLQFNCDPLRPGGERARLHQPTGRNGDGDLYVYAKSSLQRSHHRLRFMRLDEATRTALLDFLRNTAQGARNAFTWRDHLGASRTVKFVSSKLQIVQVGPGQYSTDIILREDR